MKKPKTIASLRRISVADDVAIVLKVHKASQNREQCTMTRARGDEGIAFASTTGEYLDPRNRSRALRRLLDPLDVTPVGLHAFRHTHASNLIRNGVDAKTVSERLGHRDVAFTLDRYQHLFEEQRTATAIGFDDLLGSQAPTTLRPAADTPEDPRDSVVEERVRP